MSVPVNRTNPDEHHPQYHASHQPPLSSACRNQNHFFSLIRQFEQSDLKF
jgi:hypothetical protein